jgi:hypothetical protein
MKLDYLLSLETSAVFCFTGWVAPSLTCAPLATSSFLRICLPFVELKNGAVIPPFESTYSVKCRISYVIELTARPPPNGTAALPTVIAIRRLLALFAEKIS